MTEIEGEGVSSDLMPAAAKHSDTFLNGGRLRRRSSVRENLPARNSVAASIGPSVAGVITKRPPSSINWTLPPALKTVAGRLSRAGRSSILPSQLLHLCRMIESNRRRVALFAGIIGRIRVLTREYGQRLPSLREDDGQTQHEFEDHRA